MTISGMTTFMWFDTQALDAATCYTDLFPNSVIGSVTRYPAGHPERSEDDELTVGFTLFGQQPVALNGAPQFPHSEAVSFMVSCDTQEELDSAWDSLIADGGEES